MTGWTAVDTGYYGPHSKPDWQHGEVARLNWNGFAQVPRYMDGWEVTIDRCTRNTAGKVPLYRVSIHNWRGNEAPSKHAGAEYRTVRADQLSCGVTPTDHCRCGALVQV